jgi:hypothetical protein
MRMWRALGATVSLAALSLAASASPAGAAVTVGQTFTPSQFFGGDGTFIQSGSPGNTYSVPADGVITSWSFEAAAGATPPLKLKIFRPAGGNDFTTVGASQLETPTPAALNTWPTRIAVKAGDLLGHYYTGAMTFSYQDVPGYPTHEDTSGTDTPPGSTATYSSSGDHQIDVSAVLEPDGDKDGFGDESQDKCVGTPGPSNGCPSTVALGKAKVKGTKVKVTATVPGAGTLGAGSASDPALASQAAKSKPPLKGVTQTLTGTTTQNVVLTLKLTKAAKGRLKQRGKLKLNIKAVYRPVGGPPGSATTKAKLKKKI